MDGGGGGGARPNQGRGSGSGRSNFYKRRWFYNKRGRGRGAVNNGRNRQIDQSSEASESRHSSGTDSKSPYDTQASASPPSQPKKRRNDPLESIKNCVLNKWKENFPGYYYLYYKDSVPQFSNVEGKISAIESILTSSMLNESASAFVVDAEDEARINYISIKQQGGFDANVDEILKDEEFCKLWPDFGTELCEYPEEMTKLWGLTAHKVLHKALIKHSLNNDDLEPSPSTPCIKKVRVGFFKSKPIVPLMDLQTRYTGKFVTVRGHVLRSGNMGCTCTHLTFRCKYCMTQFSLPQPNGKFQPPSRCPEDECRNKSSFMFEVIEDAASTFVINTRRITIQDVISDVETGTIPKTIECVLLDNLVGSCCSGEFVTLSGIVKVGAEQDFGAKQSLLKQYIEVSAVKQHKDSDRSMGGNSFFFSEKDFFMIKGVHETPDLFRFLVTSLCPSIYGHELIKAGLLLSLFGGSSRDGDMLTRRSDINMLMVGDPGLGKSQMLKVISEVAPRAVYVCGSASTLAGLTATVVKDGDDHSLEAGALVLADNGVCCIDEFDKMSSQHTALLEAMEQQSVSVAKAGVFRTLTARTSVIAAANPVGGHYDQTKTVSENIKINRALLSRFDLIFIILDKADKEFDRKVFEHIRNLRKGNKQMINNMSNYSTDKSKTNSSKCDDSKVIEESQLLPERLRPREGEVVDLLPHSLLRKYVAYARQYVFPKLNLEAAEVLKKFYLNFRNTHRSIDSTPVTTRQLESLMRLTEARAKLELREEATAKDAEDVLEIFHYSLNSSLDEDIHALSTTSESVLLNTTGKSSSRQSIASQAKKFLSTLQRDSIRRSKNLFSVDELNNVASALGLKSNVKAIIDTLNNEGVLLSQGGRTFKLRTTDY